MKKKKKVKAKKLKLKDLKAVIGGHLPYCQGTTGSTEELLQKGTGYIRNGGLGM